MEPEHHNKLGDLILAGVLGFIVYKVLGDVISPNISPNFIDATIKLLPLPELNNMPSNQSSGKLRTIAWGNRVSSEFRKKLVDKADNDKIDPSWLMSIFAQETGNTFSPSIKNPNSTATGLIQFLERTALSLGTNIAALAAMTATGQLDYVFNYFAPYIGRIGNLADAYMAVFYPAAIGQPGSYRIASRGSSVYTANAGLDKTGKGYITKDDAAGPVQAKLVTGLLPGNVWIGVI